VGRYQTGTGYWYRGFVIDNRCNLGLSGLTVSSNNSAILGNCARDTPSNNATVTDDSGSRPEVKKCFHRLDTKFPTSESRVPIQ
jgi:hypothetical protein